MKKVSVSVNTLNRLEKSGNLYKTAEEAKARVDIMKSGFEGGAFEVCEAYEMGEVYKYIDYTVFRGYVINS